MVEDSPDGSIEIELARSRALLMDFLRAALNLGNTFLSLATTSMNSEPGYAMELVNKAAAVVAAVRRFEGRITDPAQWNDVHERANQLEVAIGRLMKERPK